MTATYDRIGAGYRATRRPDPRIAAAIETALGDGRSVVNVGAGTGSYEPSGRQVLAVEPSDVMVRQRPAGSAPVVRARVEHLPFPDNAFDAAMGVLTLHHWTDWRRGIGEMRRVAFGPVVILTWDPDGPGFWLTDRYFPEFVVADRTRFPAIDTLAAEMGGADVRAIGVPTACVDGFLGAYWQRPHAYLDPVVRAGISSFADVAPDDPRLLRLAAEIRDGTWDEQFGSLLDLDTLDIGYRLLVAP